MSDRTPAYMAPDHDGNSLADMLSDALVCGCAGRCTCAPRRLVLARALVGLPTHPPRRPNRARFVAHEGGWLFVPEGAER